MDRRNAQSARGIGLLLGSLLSSTALGAGLVFLPVSAGIAGTPQSGDSTKPAADRNAQSKRAKLNSSELQAALDPTIAAALNRSIVRGKNGLLASVFDATHQFPGQRDAVLAHARALAPALNRDLVIAADLGILTAGQTLLLAPNAAAVMQRGPASASGIGASAYAGNAPRANNPSPNLPNPQPSLSDQTWHLTMIKAQSAYGRGYTGAGVNVTVADTGFDLANAALSSKLITAQGRNYVLNNRTDAYDPTQVGLESANDKHGTHVAGIVAATKFDNVSMHGVAYNATITPFRILAAGNDAPNAVVAPGIGEPSANALNAFANLPNTMVYNASYGPSIPNGAPPQKVWSFDPGDTNEYDALLNALKAGKLVIAANGNDREGHPDAAKNPSGLALMPYVQPGHASNNVYTDGGNKLDFSALQQQNGMVIAVMSVAQSKTAATYSNLCGVTASWCVAAPGGDTPADRGIYSTFPGNTYGFLDGTSMATPTVSGAIAVLIQAYPQYNARDLARVLFSTTEDLGLPGVDAVYGYGLIRLDRATDGPTTLAGGHVETVAANTTTYWSQPLMAGAFTKSGDGVLTIAGRTIASGAVGVTQGTLAVDGTLDVGNNLLGINAGGTLAGIGVVNGNTSVTGILSPGKMANVADLLANGSITNASQVVGNSAGTLTFNGNVTLDGAATTRIDIDGNSKVPGGPGTFDKIVVTGAGHVFTANGTLTPILRGSVGTPSNYTPPVGTHFDFVQAVNGAQATGAFATLTQPGTGLAANSRFDLIYSPSAITLHVTPTSFANIVRNTSPDTSDAAISNILDRNRVASGGVPGARSKPLYDSFYELDSEADYATATHQLGGPGVPGVTSAAMFGMQGFMGSVSDRQDALNGGAGGVQSATSQPVSFAYANRTMSAQASRAEAAFASLTPVTPSSDGFGVWAQGFGRWSTVGDSGGLAGSNSRTGGFTVGADRLLASDLIGGIAFGFARTTSTSSGARATSDSYTGALYASWTPGAAVIDLRAAAGPSRIQTSRDLILTGSPVTGSASGFGAGVTLEAGYRVPVGLATLKPFANVAWQGFRRGGYTETQQPFGLTFPSQYFDKVTTTLGIAASTQTRYANGVTLMPEFRLGWAHDWRDTTMVTQAALLDEPFSIGGAQPGREAAVFGVKLTGWTHDSLRLFVAYNGELRVNAASHQLSGGARYTW